LGRPFFTPVPIDSTVPTAGLSALSNTDEVDQVYL